METGESANCMAATTAPAPAGPRGVPPHMVLRREDLILSSKELGRGSGGVVHEAVLGGKRVAVKVSATP